MRLLHTKSLNFKEFLDSTIPKYAILSHRWEDPDSELREIELEEFKSFNTVQRRAMPKIGTFCSLARAHGFDWVWVDTCCIDKKSSAELTEAINSMYRWYKQARRCYVYFNDVEWRPDDLDDSRDQLRKSKWFTRGWTLQELLAPQFLECYDKNWTNFGDRNTLRDDISIQTRISPAHLERPETACVAFKMSWAAHRETSRIEDMAYCLLGLFDVNMPMLYGEGKNAFLRLQRKLIKKTADESIFAWNDPQITLPHGMLAPWPSAFATSNDVYVINDSEVAAVRRPYTITSRGLELFVKHPTQEACGRTGLHRNQVITFGLNCERRSAVHRDNRYLAIQLHRFGDEWQRVECDTGCLGRPAVETTFEDGTRKWPAESLSDMTTVYIKQT